MRTSGMKNSLLILLLFQFITSVGQQVTVKDPDITFSFSKPKNWITRDDGDNYMIFAPDLFNKAGMSITYFENPKETSLDEIFNAQIKYTLPSNEPGFALLNQGEEFIGSRKAKWVLYESILNEKKHVNLAYMFNENGQSFILFALARQENFNEFEEPFKQVMRSLKSTRN